MTKYLADTYTNGYTSDGKWINPIQGEEPFSIISFKYGGLDSLGDPLGYINGKLSKSYNDLFKIPLNEQIVSGPANPGFFGSARNDISWYRFSLSFNVIYRMGYYFRKNSLNYYLLFKYGEGDYEFKDRWQKPGDEAVTNVPAMSYPVDIRRNSFYANSDINVLKADNIKLNDIRLGYSLAPTNSFKSLFQRLELFTYLSNLNLMIWKANKMGIDPDFPSGLKLPLSVSAGVKIDF